MSWTGHVIFINNAIGNLQIDDDGDVFDLSCDPKVQCLNTCEWVLPNSNTVCTIDASTQVGDSICGSQITYIGNRDNNCEEGNCLYSCDIRINSAVQGRDEGLWYCRSKVKIAPGYYIDTVNVTYSTSPLSKY